jgi:hypothetical protein
VEQLPGRQLPPRHATNAAVTSTLYTVTAPRLPRQRLVKEENPVVVEHVPPVCPITTQPPEVTAKVEAAVLVANSTPS